MMTPKIPQAPSPQAESQIKTATSMILRGDDVEKIVRFVYLTGYTDGALEMARLGTEQLTAALKAAA